MADLLNPPAVRPVATRISIVGVRAAWIALAGLVVVSTAIRGFLASRVPTPWILGDETIYAELGRSLWQTGHFTILGEPTRFYTLVYPAIVGGPLSLHDLQLGYTLLKWLQALVMSLAAVPVYLWGRSLVSRGWALAAAALTLAVPGLAYSGLVMTEVAFYPVFVLAAWTMARALQRATVINQLLAVGAIALAVATRLQALVLVPAYVTAVALKLVFDRERPRALLRHLPALVGLALLAAAWSTWQLASGGGRGTDALGAYRSAGEVSYGFGDAAKYVVYHLADVVLLTGVVPACAVALLLLRPRSGPPALRAYLAVTVSLTAWLVVEVGVFASRLVGTVAERNLFQLAPLFFLGLVVWLQQGAPRRTVALASVVCGAFLLVALVPSSLITELTRWEAFTLVPLYKLHLWRSQANLRLFLLAAVVPLLALVAFPPVRRLWLVPAALLVVFGALSGVATESSIAGSRQTERLLLGGSDKRWLDEAAPAPVAFLTGGEALWTAVYENRFWNHDLQRVYTLPGFGVPGPLPQTPVGPDSDGRIVDADGRQVRARYVVASNTLTLFGKKVAAPPKAKLVLWRVRAPLRLSTWLTGLSIVSTSVDRRGDLSVGGSMAGDARLVTYACSGAFKLKLVAHERPTLVRVRRNGSPVRRGRIGSWAAFYATVPAKARKGACDLEVVSNHQLDILLELMRA
jgi:hypothetical protein